ncbi:NrdJb [Halomonadaceae bacterium KBTZ08]
MTVRIEKKIVDQRVLKEENAASEETTADDQPLVMNEHIERPEFLLGTTYKIKPPIDDHAMYITINDIILNEGTDHETRRPYEVFINSKNMEHFQWVIALTRVLSAVFRKGGDVTFLVEELRSVHDPSGGYFKKGGVFMPSLVAEIGYVIEKHMKAIGLIESEEMNELTQRMIAEKKAAYETNGEPATNAEDSYPPNATVCGKCHTKAMVVMDGCETCLACGESKCG